MKRIGIVLAAFVFTGAFVYTQESVKSVISDGNLRVLDRAVERSELWDLPPHELRVLRNTIFAKYGYIFRSTDLRNHFAKFPWYRAEQQNVDSYFSPIDKENIERIQYVERSFSGIVTYQDEMLSWIVSEGALYLHRISTVLNRVRLYQSPIIHGYRAPMQSYSVVEFPDGDSFAKPRMFCFAVGRFLTLDEIDTVGLSGYSLVFNPALLFELNIYSLYQPFRDGGIFLIAVRYDDDPVLHAQVNQIKNGSAKNILVLPWEAAIILYKISTNGTLEMVYEVERNFIEK